jgi:hypothetical protein
MRECPFLYNVLVNAGSEKRVMIAAISVARHKVIFTLSVNPWPAI